MLFSLLVDVLPSCSMNSTTTELISPASAITSRLYIGFQSSQGHTIGCAMMHHKYSASNFSDTLIAGCFTRWLCQMSSSWLCCKLQQEVEGASQNLGGKPWATAMFIKQTCLLTQQPWSSLWEALKPWGTTQVQGLTPWGTKCLQALVPWSTKWLLALTIQSRKMSQGFTPCATRWSQAVIPWDNGGCCWHRWSHSGYLGALHLHDTTF